MKSAIGGGDTNLTPSPIVCKYDFLHFTANQRQIVSHYPRLDVLDIRSPRVDVADQIKAIYYLPKIRVM
jgi:hypothetical protein